MNGSDSLPSGTANDLAALAAQAWLAAIIESSDDAIVSKTLDGIVTTWNQGAERTFGYTAAEMIGQPILKIIPDDRQEEESMILRRLRRGEPVDHFQTVRRRKDGNLVDVSVTISPVRNAEGRIIGVSKIARDITHWKEIQRELGAARRAAEQAKEEAEAANRAKDHFLSVLSHELRTPLTPVLGIISFIEKNESLPESVREQMRMVRRNVETEARLVDDLLDLTRIARGKLSLHFEVVDAHAIVRNVVAMFQNQIDEKALAVHIALRAGNHHVWADSGRFQQALLNLMSNAVKFTPQDGSITLRSCNDGADLKIEVADSGVGIDAETLPRLFKAFEQGEQPFARRFGGLGLGLSIVRSLMEMHNGSVAAFSAGKDQGATFTIRLPTMTAVDREVSRAAAAAVAPPKSCRILLVEDHADTRNVMSMLLRSFGCDVAVAASVKEATELANGGAFDLLICDFGLPDGTGLDVMRQIHQRQKIKAIAVTGFGQDEDLRRSKEAGFSVHLTKPVNIEALQHAIQEAVA